MDIKEIQNLIKFVSKSGVEEVKIEREKFKPIQVNDLKKLSAQKVFEKIKL